MTTNTILIKLGVSDNAEFPDSSAGDESRTGYFSEKPTLNQGFYFSEHDGSLFRTSYVVEITKETESEIVFKTNNSIYQLSFNLFDSN